MPNIIIEINNLSFTYPDGTAALKNISLSIQEKKKIALLGSNGCGKSTLFLHLNGILKPTSVDLSFRGVSYEYTKKGTASLRKEVGLVLQHAEHQLFHTNVMQDIAFGSLNVFRDEAAARPHIKQAITRMQVEPFLDKPVHFLSYGQKKRVAIAGVLAMDPSVVVLDEPTAGLDNYYTNQLRESLNTIHQEGKTVILSTHDLEFAYEWADEFIVMADGEVLAAGGHEAIFLDGILLNRAHLKKPLIVKVYEELQKDGFQDNMPRTEGELIRRLKEKQRIPIVP